MLRFQHACMSVHVDAVLCTGEAHTAVLTSSMFLSWANTVVTLKYMPLV